MTWMAVTPSISGMSRSISTTSGRSRCAIRTASAPSDEVVRQGLRAFLEVDADLEVVGEAALEAEYRMYGIPSPPASVRIAQLDEAIQVCKLLWTTERSEFAGQYYTLV
jgi:hypothetical protein